MKEKKQNQKDETPSLKSALTFFNSKVTQLNNQRLQLNRSKGMARYLAKSHPNPRDLAPLDTTMGVMSFTLYILRFSANIALLTELIMSNTSESNDTKRRDLYYSLWNDSLWGTVNLAQFFWLSFSNSESAGFYGLQLEVFAQLIDILVMVIRFLEFQKEYQARYMQANESEKKCLAIEWQNKELNFIRSVITASSVALILGLVAFSIVSVPVAPILSPILLFSSLLKVLLDWDRDKQLIQQMISEGANLQQIVKEESALTRDRLNELNQVLLNHIFIPAGLFLLITCSFSLLLTGVFTMALTYYGISFLIDISYDDEETSEYQITYRMV